MQNSLAPQKWNEYHHLGKTKHRVLAAQVSFLQILPPFHLFRRAQQIHRVSQQFLQ